MCLLCDLHSRGEAVLNADTIPWIMLHACCRAMMDTIADDQLVRLYHLYEVPLLKLIKDLQALNSAHVTQGMRGLNSLTVAADESDENII